MRTPTLLSSFFSLLLAIPIAADDTARLTALFAPVSERGGVVTIPPGDYRLVGAAPIPLASDTTVFAHGARFHFPESLDQGARIVLFAGSDLRHFAWHGGTFLGRVIVRDNVFQLGDSAPEETVTFAPNGHELQMTGNSFSRQATLVAVDPSCERIEIRDNPGAELKRTPIDFNHGRR